MSSINCTLVNMLVNHTSPTVTVTIDIVNTKHKSTTVTVPIDIVNTKHKSTTVTVTIDINPVLIATTILISRIAILRTYYPFCCMMLYEVSLI